jgi:hypothetical protein
MFTECSLNVPQTYLNDYLAGSGQKGEVKEREKMKRTMGQNGRDSVTWKSEEEMILRQQFDS